MCNENIYTLYGSFWLFKKKKKKINEINLQVTISIFQNPLIGYKAMATNSARAINVHDSRVIPAPQALRSSRYKRGSARRDSLIRWLEHTGTGRFSGIHRALFVRVSHMRVPSASERTSYSVRSEENDGNYCSPRKSMQRAIYTAKRRSLQP